MPRMDGGGGAIDRLTIVHYWHDGEPPAYIAELLATFRAHNPEMRQVVFDESMAEKLIARNLGEREVAAFRSCAVPAMQADYFRYCAALAWGGVYCDADVRCKAGLRTLMPTRGEGWLVLRPHGAIVNGLFAFGSPGHPLLEMVVDVATANIEGRSWKSVYMATGPALLTAMYWMHLYGSFDAFIANAPGPGWERYARVLNEVVGDCDRVIQAFEGVQITPASELNSFVQSTGMHFPYKESDTHWSNARGSIYREPLQSIE